MQIKHLCRADAVKLALIKARKKAWFRTDGDTGYAYGLALGVLDEGVEKSVSERFELSFGEAVKLRGQCRHHCSDDEMRVPFALGKDCSGVHVPYRGCYSVVAKLASGEPVNLTGAYVYCLFIFLSRSHVCFSYSILSSDCLLE